MRNNKRIHQENETTILHRPHHNIIKEVGNAIWKYFYLRRIIKQDEAIRLYKAFLKLVEKEVITLEPETKYIEIALQIALQHGITLYDSLYLAQAQKRGELLTSDKNKQK